MHPIIYLLTISLLATSTFGRALEGPIFTAKGFSISQKQSGIGKTGPGLLREVYHKYNRPVPEHIKRATSGGEASVLATPEPNDVEYLSYIEIGGQNLSLQFDTGSADLWVFSDLLSSTQSQGHRLYRPADSPTAHKVTGSNWKVSYGDQSGASGSVYTDNVNIGGITVVNQAIEVAQQVSPLLTRDTLSDGVFGLGFGSINQIRPSPQHTFFENAVDQGLLAQNLFTVDLKKGKPGIYNFGYIDHSATSGPLIYTRVYSSRGYWNVLTTGHSIGTKFNSTRFSGMVDTGTTLMFLPDEIVEDYYSQVPSAKFEARIGGYTVDCAAADTLPDFTVHVEHDPFKVPGRYIIAGPVFSDKSACLGGMQTSSDLGVNIFGDVFLKAVFAVFDPSGPKIAFANKPLD